MLLLRERASAIHSLSFLICEMGVALELLKKNKSASDLQEGRRLSHLTPGEAQQGEQAVALIGVSVAPPGLGPWPATSQFSGPFPGECV